MSNRSDTSITITLNHVELVKWHALAKALGLTLEQLAKESIDLVAMIRARVAS